MCLMSEAALCCRSFSFIILPPSLFKLFVICPALIKQLQIQLHTNLPRALVVCLSINLIRSPYTKPFHFLKSRNVIAFPPSNLSSRCVCTKVSTERKKKNGFIAETQRSTHVFNIWSTKNNRTIRRESQTLIAIQLFR